MHDQYIESLVQNDYKEQYENNAKFKGYVDELVKGASAEKILRIVSELCGGN